VLISCEWLHLAGYTSDMNALFDFTFDRPSWIRYGYELSSEK
jgi:hypothetical protein